MPLEQQDIWRPAGGIILEEAANRALRFDGNALVIAGPGAGKTELLAQRACFLLQTGECAYPSKILAVSFKTDAAKNLAERVEERCGGDGRERFASLTFDAFAKSILDRFRNGLSEWLRPTLDYALGNIKQDSFLVESSHSFRYAKPDLFERDVLDAIKQMHETEPLSFILKAPEDNRSHLTFKMVFALAQCILDTNPLIADAVRRTYSHVFLDEFQDITRDQYRMVRGLFRNHSNIITAVGDNKQRIMLWADAMENAFEMYDKDFAPHSFRLLSNYRSAPRLVNLQVQMFSALNEESQAPLITSGWRDDDGQIRLLLSNDEQEEAAWIAKDIKDAIAEGTKPEEICLIYKQKVSENSTEITQALSDYGIASRIEADYQEIIDDRFMKYLLDFALISTQEANPKTWDTVESLTMEMKGVPYDADYPTYAEHSQQLYLEMDSMRESLHHIRSSLDIFDALKGYCEWLRINAIASQFPEYEQEGLLTRRLFKMSELLYMDMKAEKCVRRGIERLRGKGVIPLMTIHKCKGLEYRRVYLIGLEDEAFWSFKKQPEETRCAFFVAISRAIESLTFTYCSQRNGKPQSRRGINEFYDLLLQPGMAEIINAT